MKFAVISAALAACALATPFSFPLPNGFPHPSDQTLLKIQQQSGGTLPNSSPPHKLSDAAVNRLRLVAANELFEVAFFTSLYHNITSDVPGYRLHGRRADEVKTALKRIIAQEELHALGANGILKAVGKDAVEPCKYQFPTTSFPDAITLANTFTDVVLGTLPELQTIGAKDGGDGLGLVSLLSAVIANEAEQTGWFRSVVGLPPSAAPFITSASFQFALSAVSSFLVPGSCPAAYADVQKAIKPFPALTVVEKPTARRPTVRYSVTGNVDSSKYAIAYQSGINVPVTVAITDVRKRDGKTFFSADFPAAITPKAGFSSGLTIAALTSSKRSYSNISDVSGSTLYGPGLIEYNY